METLRVVAAHEEPITLTQMHEETGYPKSTLVRLLSVLEEQAYLVRHDERPSYRLGHGVLPIAVGYFRTFTGVDLLRPHLNALAQATGWTANLGTLSGDRILHVCVEFPDRPIYYTTSEGSLAPAYCTGLGKAILSQLGDDDVLKALPPEPFERLTESTIVTVANMKAELARVRERGYALWRGRRCTRGGGGRRVEAHQRRHPPHSRSPRGAQHDRRPVALTPRTHPFPSRPRATRVWKAISYSMTNGHGMRFLTYVHDGSIRHGRLEDDGLTIRDIGEGDLLRLLEAGPLSEHGFSGTVLRMADVTILPPLPRPPKLLAVAANYASHVVNSGGTPVDPRHATPRFFLKPSSAISAFDTPLTPPRSAVQVDWEVELAVVIGERCKDVPVGRALDMVAGYMTANDISCREAEYPYERDPESVHPFFDWLAGKWADGYAPFGPFLVSADEVPDPQALELHLDVNGDVRQSGSTSELIFGVAELIAHASHIMTLEPGDIIETGTTGGAGVETGVYLAPGDIMTARVGNLGEIRTHVNSWRDG